MSDTQSSTDRVAFITGASRGIGAGIALSIARSGFIPVLAVRDVSAARNLTQKLQEQGSKAYSIACDVSDTSSVRRAIDECLSHTGRLDALINNAGQIAPIGLLANTNPDAWIMAVSVNLGGAYRCVQAALPALLASPSPVVVNISTGAARTVREGWSAYCSSKAGLAMLTRCIAAEYPQVRSYGLQPGFVDTDMQAQIRHSGINEISRMPRDRLASPERPAAFVAWLCDTRPHDLNGQDLTVNDAALEQRVRGPL